MTLTCYIDEAGCSGSLPSASAGIQPFLILAAVSLRTADDTVFTRQFTAIKQTYFDSRSEGPRVVKSLFQEIKGCELKAEMRREPRGTGPAHVLLNSLLSLLAQFNASLFARVAIKPLGEKFEGKKVYALAMHQLAGDFHRLLELRCLEGSIVADFREANLNALMSQPICDAKYQLRDELPRLAGAPTFGLSQSHAGLQAADILASALLFPTVSFKQRAGLSEHPHLHENDRLIALRFRTRLRGLQPPTWALPVNATQHDLLGLAPLLE